MKQVRLQTEARGFTGIFGKDIDKHFRAARQELSITERLFWPPHVTLLRNAEAKSVKPALARRRFPEAVLREVTPVGIGGYPELGIYYLVVLCPAAQRHRQALGLQPKDLHITLSPHDDQQLAKGLDTLLQPVDWQAVSSKTLQLYVQHLIMLQSSDAPHYAQDLCRASLTWPPSWITLGEALLCQGSSSAAHESALVSATLLAYARACAKTVHPKTLKEIRKLLRRLRLRPQQDKVQEVLVSRMHQIEGLQEDIRRQLCTPWSAQLNGALSR